LCYSKPKRGRDLRLIQLLYLSSNLRSSRFEDLSVSQWLSHTPPDLVMAHLNIDRATYDQILKEKLVVLPE
jgi:hypothetical protein